MSCCTYTYVVVVCATGYEAMHASGTGPYGTLEDCPYSNTLPQGGGITTCVGPCGLGPCAYAAPCPSCGIPSKGSSRSGPNATSLALRSDPCHTSTGG
ncbi:hypothetical protein KI387_014069, partial [Taxus chinensis]